MTQMVVNPHRFGGLHSIWDPAVETPATPDNDPDAVNLGIKFQADQDGEILAVRFHKSVNNTGTHIGALYTVGGTLLGSVTFTGESASGWQEQAFASPIAISADTTHIIVYFAPDGNYSADSLYFDNTEVDNPPLLAIDNDAEFNGVFEYAAVLTFPTQTFNATNYWVDVVFRAT